MKQGVALNKIVVVLSSLLLASGFVYYQAGGDLFPSSKSGRAVWERRQKEKLIEEQAENQAEELRPTEAVVVPSSQPSKRMLLPGSKAAVFVRPADERTDDNQKTEKPAVQRAPRKP